MSDEIQLAFAHPDARAAATAGDAPRDRISLRDHTVAVEIGAFQVERDVTQRLSFNVVVEVEPVAVPLEDDVDRILSYDRITEAIAQELAAERLNLLETLAERIADRILQHPQAWRVFLRIEKLDRGPGALGVEIVRGRIDAQRAAQPGVVQQPRVAFLDGETLEKAGISPLIDLLSADGAPLVLCADRTFDDASLASSAAVQRRIDLLALEQVAWRLAGRDERCVVVGSRTELEWAMKNAQISVWAPSKIVLDAVGGANLDPRRPLDLASWLAGEFRAAELVCIGTNPPIGCRVPARRLDGKT